MIQNLSLPTIYRKQFLELPIAAYVGQRPLQLRQIPNLIPLLFSKKFDCNRLTDSKDVISKYYAVVHHYSKLTLSKGYFQCWIESIVHSMVSQNEHNLRRLHIHTYQCTKQEFSWVGPLPCYGGNTAACQFVLPSN